MKSLKRSIALLSAISMFALVACSANSCSGEDTFEIESSKPDLNYFDKDISTDDAKAWILATYNNVMSLDGMEIKSKIPQLNYRETTIPIPEIGKLPETITKLKIDAGLEQKVSILGLTTKKPELVKSSVHAQNIYCKIEKPGINPAKENKVELENGEAFTYVKDTYQYNDYSNKKIRDFLPYVLYGFDSEKYSSVEQAQTALEDMPEKFKDPNPVITEKDVPINKKITSIKGISFDMMLLQLIKANNKSDKKFLTFLTNGENLKMSIDLKRDNIIDLLVNIAELQGSEITRENIEFFVYNLLTLNSLNFSFIFTKENLLDYSKIDIDFTITIPDSKDGNIDLNNLVGVTTLALNIEADSWFNFKDPVVIFPNDLKSYEEYHLEIPMIKLPNIDDIIAGIKPKDEQI